LSVLAFGAKPRNFSKKKTNKKNFSKKKKTSQKKTFHTKKGQSSEHIVCCCLVARQGCQMVCFQTENPYLGKFWSVMQWKM
jgi:hypothetical protein